MAAQYQVKFHQRKCSLANEILQGVKKHGSAGSVRRSSVRHDGVVLGRSTGPCGRCKCRKFCPKTSFRFFVRRKPDK